MTEFELNENGMLEMVCDHSWGEWVHVYSFGRFNGDSPTIRHCDKCSEYQEMVPLGTNTIEPVPVKEGFRDFLKGIKP